MELETIYHDNLHLRLHEHGKAIFEKYANAIPATIAESLKKLDMHNYLPTKSDKEYLSDAYTLANYDELVLWAKHAVHFHKNKQYDDTLSLEMKKELLQNTVNLLRQEFIRSSNITKDNESKLIQKHKEILENLELKINDNTSLNKILKILGRLELNFYINFEETPFYPIIIDILRDSFTHQYVSYDIRTILQAMSTVYSDIKKEQKETKLLLSDMYNKIEFFEHVKHNQVLGYVLYDHAQKLDIDVKKYRELYKEILYYIPNNHRHSPPDIDIKKSKHLFVADLEFTKLVI